MSKCLILGFFDGIHKAHRAVINSAFKYSDDVTLITFKESPSKYFTNIAEYIFSRNESVEKIKSLGVAQIVELDFSKIAKISAEEYVKSLVEEYNPMSILTGFNHTFGYKKEGNAEVLKLLSKKYGFMYECIPPVIENGEIVSSTLIKEYLKNGNVEYANFLLESNFVLEGSVIHGAKIGRTIGFPTANIRYPKNIVKLPFGVYFAEVNRKKAVMNWGMKPTLNNIQEPVLEVHIINFNGDLYDKDIRVEVLKQVRSEQKFDSLDELKEQIKRDVNLCLEL